MKSITWNMVFVLALIGCSRMAQGTIIIDEKFDTDPGWTRTMAPHGDFGYNSTQHNIALSGTSTNPGLFYRDTSASPARYATALPGSVTQDTDFTFSFDYVINSSSASSSVVGLFKSGANNYSGTARGAMVRMGYSTYSYECKLIVFTSGGLIQAVTEYSMMSGSMEVSYDAASRIFSWKFTKSDGTRQTRTLALPSGYTFESDQFGVGNRDDGYDYTWWKGTFDNMYLTSTAVPEPMTLGLLTIGGIMGLVKRRK